jgi:hypothetical protein
MAAEIPKTEPLEFRVGDTFKFKKWLTDYDPATDTLGYTLVNSDHIYEITCTDNGDGYFLANVLPTVTRTWQPGTYAYQAHVTTGSDRFTVGSGTIKLLPDLTRGAVDTRSHVKITLDALEATLQGRATQDQLSYSINGRSISKIPATELIEWHSHYSALYRQEVQAERINNGAGKSNLVRVRF